MRILDKVFLELEPQDHRLEEAKAYGTVRGTHATRDLIVTQTHAIAPHLYRAVRKASTSSHRKRFDTYSADMLDSMLSALDRYEAGDSSFSELERTWKEWLREAYREAFVHGLRSSGAHVHARHSAIPDITPEDERYITSAIRDEMKYLNNFLNDIRTGASRGGSIRMRLKMYIDTLDGIYAAGRVMGTPETYMIVWVSKLDGNTCPGCRFMAENSPYHRDNLPTTPRAGSCKCLSRCRCALLMRHTTPANLRVLVDRSLTKGTLMRRLASLKAWR